MELQVNDDALEDALARIESARTWSPRVVSRLEHLVRTAADEDLFRVNPLRWASDRGVDEYEAVDLSGRATSTPTPWCGSTTAS
jgi:hypothetical protein